MTWDVRPLLPAEYDAFRELVIAAFGGIDDPEEAELDRRTLPPELVRVVADGDELIGATAAFDLDLAVPGGAVLATAGVTAVGVAPTHRRLGVVRTLMTAQLTEIAAAGRQPLAALYASEPTIYGRYGYGEAARPLRLTVPRPAARLLAAPGPGRVLRCGLDKARPLLTATFAAGFAARPGYFRRDDGLWDARLFDSEKQREGRSPLVCVLHEDAGGIDGYVLYRTRPRWDDAGPAGEVDVLELLALTPSAYTGLWAYLFGLDLMRTITVGVAPDDPVLQLLANPWAAQPRVEDGLWIRVVDVGTALSARRYAAPVDVVLELADELLPDNAGRWRVVGDRTGGRAERTTADADLALDVATLGAVYLGSAGLPALADIGRVVEHRPGALDATATAFSWPRAPYCPMNF